MNVYILFRYYQLSETVNCHEEKLSNQAVILIKLTYHKALEMEDYETMNLITKTMPADFDYNKFL
jgi:hypothetical protein